MIRNANNVRRNLVRQHITLSPDQTRRVDNMLMRVATLASVCETLIDSHQLKAGTNLDETLMRVFATRAVTSIQL